MEPEKHFGGVQLERKTDRNSDGSHSGETFESSGKLKIRCPEGRVGSTAALGTIPFLMLSRLRL